METTEAVKTKNGLIDMTVTKSRAATVVAILAIALTGAALGAYKFLSARSRAKK